MVPAHPTYLELESLAARIISSSAPLTESASEIQRVSEVVGKEPNDAIGSLHRAILAFLKGFAALGEGHRSEADAHFESATNAAKRSLRREDSSEAHRVLADAYNQLLEIRPTSYAVLNAGGARRAAVRAVELNPGNPLAHLSAAAYLSAAPAIAGGDLTQARFHLEQAGSNNNHSEYQEFLILIWWGRYHSRRGSASAAAEAFAAARAIYPESWWLEHVLEEMDR